MSKKEIYNVLEQWVSGLISMKEANDILADANIHGGFDNKGFCGYDYFRQEWITYEF